MALTRVGPRALRLAPQPGGCSRMLLCNCIPDQVPAYRESALTFPGARTRSLQDLMVREPMFIVYHLP